MRVVRRCTFVLVLAVAGCGTAPPSAPPAAAPVVAEPAPVEPDPMAAAALPPPRLEYPAHGSGEWVAAPAQQGGSGLRYRVRVERDIAHAEDFAAIVAETLDDPRGWRGGGQRFRRVGGSDRADFTIYLATPGTRDELCGAGVDGYTSCRVGDQVVVNVARWADAVPGYDLTDYRRYVINHEVGHRLGHGHELCPGKGKPAPVMLQQTLGLHGCTANPWPYLNGKRWSGRSGAYDDPVPPPSGGTR